MNSRVFITGFMGSGKTFWGKIWAEKNSLQFFDLDDQIEKAEGKTISEIFENDGEAYFRERERAALEQFMDKDNYILSCGGGTPCFFDNAQWMNDQGITVYLQASPGQIVARIKNETRERPLLSGLSLAELGFFIEQKLSVREPFYKQAKYILNVDVLTADSLSGIVKGR